MYVCCITIYVYPATHLLWGDVCVFNNSASKQIISQIIIELSPKLIASNRTSIKNCLNCRLKLSFKKQESFFYTYSLQNLRFKSLIFFHAFIFRSNDFCFVL